MKAPRWENFNKNKLEDFSLQIFGPEVDLRKYGGISSLTLLLLAPRMRGQIKNITTLLAMLSPLPILRCKL